MRLPRSMMPRGRKMQKEPVPFQELLPLSLKDRVSGKGDKDGGVTCLQEMSVMFACLKKYEFDQALCPKEIASFQNCYKQSLDKKFAQKQQELKGEIITGTKNLGHKQINQILRKFPST